MSSYDRDEEKRNNVRDSVFNYWLILDKNLNWIDWNHHFVSLSLRPTIYVFFKTVFVDALTPVLVEFSFYNQT